MARRSLRNSTSAKSTPIKPSKPSPSQKRPSSKSTPKKSPYFKQTAKSKAAKDGSPDPEQSSPDMSEDEASGYEEEATGQSSSSASEEEELSDSDSPRPKKRQKLTPKSRAGGGKTANAASKTAKGQELWRPGVKAGLGPGKQVIIDKPKARSAGKTPYTDDTIHPNTMLFLSELEQNNDRSWLKMHDPDYRASWKDFTSFLESLQKRIMEIDETVPELPIKDVFFRIYRDIRFSNDSTPYKAHFSAAWSRTGRKGPYAHYYVQIKPGGRSFVGGGLWHPEADQIARMRRDIDRRPRRLKDTLKNAEIRKEFFDGVANNDEKVVDQFVQRNAEGALKTKPRDYDANHRDIELLRLKNYNIGRRLDDSEVVGPKGIRRVAELFRCMAPFVTYLNSTVMPDEEEESAGSSQSD